MAEKSNLLWIVVASRSCFWSRTVSKLCLMCAISL